MPTWRNHTRQRGLRLALALEQNHRARKQLRAPANPSPNRFFREPVDTKGCSRLRVQARNQICAGARCRNRRANSNLKLLDSSPRRLGQSFFVKLAWRQQERGNIMRARKKFCDLAASLSSILTYFPRAVCEGVPTSCIKRN